jgi:hypothetical protein
VGGAPHLQRPRTLTVRRSPFIVNVVVAQIVLLGFAVLAYTTNSASPDNSGIVEESVGGAGDAFVIAIIIFAIPAVVVGALQGLLARRVTTTRWVVHVGLGVLLAAFAGVMVAALTEQECDGTCTDVPLGVLFASLAAAELALVASWAIGMLLARIRRR